MKKPALQTLQHFVDLYLQSQGIAVSFKDMDAWGRANLEAREIYLNPHIPKDIPLKICLFGGCTYKPKFNVRLRDGEQYFLTLLHEIGHFKVKVKAPDSFYYYKKQLMDELNNYETDSLLEKIKHKQSLKFVYELVNVKRRPYESWQDLRQRKLEFLSWLFGSYNRQHRKLHSWAISEFIHKRAVIDTMLYG